MITTCLLVAVSVAFAILDVTFSAGGALFCGFVCGTLIGGIAIGRP